MNNFDYISYALIKKLIEKEGGEENIPEEYLKEYHKYKAELEKPKQTKIFKLTKEKIADTERRVQESRIIKISMFNETGVEKLIDSLREDSYLDNLLSDDD